MWKTRRLNICEIVDEKTNRVIASVMDENQAQAICEKHNAELGDKKWNKVGDKGEGNTVIK